MDGFFTEIIRGAAESIFGDTVKSAFGGADAYAEGRSTQTSDLAAGEIPYVYERVLTRPRELNINDR